MKLEDYLHLYIGCHLNVEYGYEGTKKIGILTGYDEVYGWQVFRPDVVLAPYIPVRDELIRPILRPLSDMTEEEYSFVAQCLNMKTNENLIKIGLPDRVTYIRGLMENKNLLITKIEGLFQMFTYLLSKHFDLFGLHEAGLCYYKNEKRELI